MKHVAGRKLVAALSLGFVAYFVWGGTLAESRRTAASGVELDHLIPREKWEGAGLNRLTVPEQEILAGEIAALMGSGGSAQSTAPAGIEKSQWRKLHRRMSKDDVRKLLGEPRSISASRYCESWTYYSSGTVTFDSKGRLDFWIEP
jgi:hypothetical protein